MTPLVNSRLAVRASGAIARRQRRARIARWLALPALSIAAYLGRVNQWLALSGVGVVVLLLILVFIGVQQKCVRCEGLLVTRHWWGEEFAPTCPECGCD